MLMMLFVAFRLMKIQRTVVLVENSLDHFYSRNFMFDNFNFLNLDNTLPRHEEDEFSLTKRTTSYREFFINGYRTSLRTLLKETRDDSEVARRRFPYIYIITRLIHLSVLFMVTKLSYQFSQKYLTSALT